MYQAIKPTEISVDAGTKHACYVPLDQLTSDPSAKPEDIVKIGDELELMVVRVNDVEGTAMLSKTRLDAVAGFEKVMNAGETGEILTGVVTEVIKGGVLVLTNGVKVFIPASQTGIPRDGDLNTLLRKEVALRSWKPPSAPPCRRLHQRSGPRGPQGAGPEVLGRGRSRQGLHRQGEEPNQLRRLCGSGRRGWPYRPDRPDLAARQEPR